MGYDLNKPNNECNLVINKHKKQTVKFKLGILSFNVNNKNKY